MTANGQQRELPLTLIIKRVGDKLAAESTGSDDINITAIKPDGDNVTLGGVPRKPTRHAGSRLREGYNGL